MHISSADPLSFCLCWNWRDFSFAGRAQYVHTSVNTVRYTLFEWNEAKNRGNIRKHGIGFSTAASLFDHPHCIRLDVRKDYREDRWIAVGWIGPMLGLVVFNEQDNGVARVIRIISARKASTREVELYEKEFRN